MAASRESPRNCAVVSVSEEDSVIYTLDSSGATKGRQATLRRPYQTIVLALMVGTSSIAVFDLYLFASSALH
jgi:hypothetical protein